MAKVTMEKALKSGTKWKSAQAAKKVFVLIILFFIGPVLGQLALIGKRKRYLLTFLLAVAGLAAGVMMAIRMATPDDTMYTEAQFAYYESLESAQANGEPFSYAEISYGEAISGTLNYYMNGSSFVGAAVVFPAGQDGDGNSLYRIFTEDGEISEDELDAGYGRYKHSTDVSTRSLNIEYEAGSFYHNWTYQISGESETRHLKYSVPKELVSITLKLDEKSDVAYLRSFTYNRTTGKLDYIYNKSNVTLIWNENHSKYESRGDYYVHSAKYEQTRMMMIIGFIAGGIGVLLTYVFLIRQMCEADPYLKYMKRCEKQLPKEAREAFRDRADECLRTGDMEGARALLAEHQLI